MRKESASKEDLDRLAEQAAADAERIAKLERELAEFKAKVAASFGIDV